MAQSLRFLVDEQKACLARLQRADVQLTVVGEVTESKVRVALDFLEKSWTAFSDYHQALLAFLNTDDDEKYDQLRENEYFKQNVYDMGEKAYITNKAALQDRLKPYDEARSAQASILHSTRTEAYVPNVRVNKPQPPPIQIPKFDGNILHWANFQGLFEAIVVENSDFTLSQKLQYLQQSLTGTAAQRICHLPPTAENFYRAWNGLVNFYDNRRVQISSQVRALLDLPSPKHQSAREMEQFHASMTQHIEALRALERPVDEWGDLLVEVLARKLDKVTLREWEQHLGSSTVPPTFNKFDQFVLGWVRTLGAMEGLSASSLGQNVKPKTAATAAKVFHAEASSSQMTIICENCSGPHYISKCNKFLDMTSPERNMVVKEKKLCYNCLSKHPVKECSSKFNCKECHKKHHTLLHNTKSITASETSQTSATFTPRKNSQKAPSTNVAQSQRQIRALLPTAILKVVNNVGDKVEVRALLDQGSEVSLITEALAKQLRLPKKPAPSPIIGIGAGTPKKALGQMVISAHACNSNSCFSVSVSILPRLTGCLPNTKIDARNWPEFQKLTLADPSFHLPGKIDMLLGADVYGQLLTGGLIPGTANSPTAQNTALGWLVSGNVQDADYVSSTSSSTSVSLLNKSPFRSFLCVKEQEIVNMVKTFWLQEEDFSTVPKELTDDEINCVRQFQETTTRNAEGRYVVRLPIKTKPLNLGESRSIAMRILKSQEKELKQNQQKRESYTQFMKDYLEQGFMIPTETPQELENCFYMPHHGIYKESSSTTKLRVVFNASKNNKSGMSLNSHLYEGPKLLADLPEVLTKWRKFKWAFTADVSKMYPQILVHPDDQNLQRIVWRENCDSKIQDFKMTRVTFGVKAAPFLALSTIKQLEKDEGYKYPLAEKENFK